MTALITRATVPRAPELGQIVLEARGVSVDLGGTQIIDGIDLDVRCGEMLAIVGPNGAGKSTLLAALAGDRRYRGSITVDGREVSRWRAPDLALRRAMLRQENTLSFPFTVLDVVKMGRAPWQRITTPAENERVIAMEMTRTDTLRFATRPFTSLSGGERARVSLTRVLVQATPVLLLDEPTAALDMNYQEQVLAIARQAARRGCAVAVVLHDLAAAAAYADRLLLLDDGRLSAVGTPAEVLDSTRLTEVYRHPIEVTPRADGVLNVVPMRFADDTPPRPTSMEATP
ncbi:heme ABC transporter ATP-binding protein [Aeromicrobium sp. PE09-221]|uniref:heme ABC transporter ATP-binding protein n=1 Tax=Aeromicrobium sp. PE09-221 TaxID=1898043 RepID=UPI000B3ED6FC|nr:heme ABC transporter ATP-binding protein [Aeromicrobium sp. PE09-221]OUZ07688.1 heme ABC transporter ATP-binding protein [Aeromicrobium sp. PE09-221]